MCQVDKKSQLSPHLSRGAPCEELLGVVREYRTVKGYQFFWSISQAVEHLSEWPLCPHNARNDAAQQAVELRGTREDFGFLLGLPVGRLKCPPSSFSFYARYMHLGIANSSTLFRALSQCSSRLLLTVEYVFATNCDLNSEFFPSFLLLPSSSRCPRFAPSRRTEGYIHTESPQIEERMTRTAFP